MMCFISVLLLLLLLFSVWRHSSNSKSFSYLMLHWLSNTSNTYAQSLSSCLSYFSNNQPVVSDNFLRSIPRVPYHILMFTDWFLFHSTDIEISSPLRITRKGYGDMFYADAERSKISISLNQIQNIFKVHYLRYWISLATQPQLSTNAYAIVIAEAIKRSKIKNKQQQTNKRQSQR